MTNARARAWPGPRFEVADARDRLRLSPPAGNEVGFARPPGGRPSPIFRERGNRSGVVRGEYRRASGLPGGAIREPIRSRRRPAAPKCSARNRFGRRFSALGRRSRIRASSGREFASGFPGAREPIGSFRGEYRRASRLPRGAIREAIRSRADPPRRNIRRGIELVADSPHGCDEVGSARPPGVSSPPISREREIDRELFGAKFGRLPGVTVRHPIRSRLRVAEPKWTARNRIGRRFAARGRRSRIRASSGREFAADFPVARESIRSRSGRRPSGFRA